MKKILTYAGERWRAFKVQLLKHYILGSHKDKSPCEDCPFIDKETWAQFVERSLNPAFQVSWNLKCYFIYMYSTV